MTGIIRSHEDIRAGLAALERLDARLATVAGMAGPVPLRRDEPGFASLAAIIVSQMLSRASAEAIWGRILAAGPVDAERYRAYPPEIVAGFGLSRAKAATLSHLAGEVAAGRFDPVGICRLDTAQAMAGLVALPGIGPWTAEVYLMFSGGHADIFPAGDVALQAAIAHGFGLEARPTPRQLAEMAAAWSPFRSVAARLLWAYYATRMGRSVMPLG